MTYVRPSIEVDFASFTSAVQDLAEQQGEEMRALMDRMGQEMEICHRTSRSSIG